MHGWLRRPRSQGRTLTQPAASPAISARIVEHASRDHRVGMRPLSGVSRAGRQVAFVLSAVFASTGCVGSGEGVPNVDVESGPVPTSYGELQAVIFTPVCAARCHGGGVPSKGLPLDAARAIGALVSVSSSEVPDLERITPRRPEDSYLVVKLVRTDARRIGARMPRGGPPYLTDPQIRAIKRWIADGAEESWVYTSTVPSSLTPLGLAEGDGSERENEGEGQW